jgi:predicted ester cyclase
LSNNIFTEPSSKLVKEHLRAIEAGNWELALSYLSENYTMTGLAPFPIRKDHALDIHKARKAAFPDFKFNEEILESTQDIVKIRVHITGTHLGELKYPMGNLPVVPPTGKQIDLPYEYFDYTVKDNKINGVLGRIPEGAGSQAMMKQLGISR